jgi:hypothetical protein
VSYHIITPINSTNLQNLERLEIFHVTFEAMSILFGWILPILFIISLVKSQKGIPAIVDDQEVPRTIGEIIQQWNELETGTHVVQVLNFVKKSRNYGKVHGMVGDVIAEIPKDNPVIRLAENWMNVKKTKIAGTSGSLLIFVFDEISMRDVSFFGFSTGTAGEFGASIENVKKHHPFPHCALLAKQ